ncbi:MAG: histidine kinase [Chitinophagales bacterium]|nr:ATP-binding protein [Chitinophagales bacterium]MCZ2393185.1 histidine kinase [Chitinophagales bacterium]
MRKILYLVGCLLLGYNTYGYDLLDSLQHLSFNEIQTNSKNVIEQVQKIVKASQLNRDTATEAKAKSVLALAYYYNGNYEENKKYALQSIQLYKALGDKKNLAISLGEVGYRQKNIDLKNANYYLQQAILIAEENQFQKQLADIYNNYGVIKSMFHQDDSAIYYIEKSIALKLQFKDYIGLPYSYNNLGDIYLNKNIFDKAKSYFDLAMKIRKDSNDIYGISDNYAYLGDYYLKIKSFNQAITAYHQSLNIADSLNISNLKLHNYQMLIESYKGAGLYENALQYAIYRQKYGDSILNIQTNDKIVKYQIDYESKEKENLILQQNEKIIKNKLSIKTRNFLILTLSFIALFIVFISYIIYRSQVFKYDKQQKENQLKIALNEIEYQKKLIEQRHSISKDLHDNIGSHLTFIISSVDNIKQSFASINNQTLLAQLSAISTFSQNTIRELRDTIWAMNKNEIKIIDLKNRSLNFINSAKMSTDKITFTFHDESSELDNISFNSKIGIHIYRILQEAIQNTIKHAQASHIQIYFQKANSQLQIIIEDNGIGFDIHQENDGNGLYNMKQRSQSINGQFEISSESGKTIVQINIPLNYN